MNFAATCTELHDISPPFSIENDQIISNSAVLPQFGSLPLPGSLGGTVAFVGGPVWALDWHQDGVHLALTANRAAQTVHRVSETYQGNGHVQIWRAGPDSLQLIALASHEGDTAWDLSWRPPTPDATAITIAAALANGQLTLFHYPSDKQPTPFEEQPLTVHLRKSNDLLDGVRVAEWSRDGNRLASGTLKGCVEIWGLRKQENGIAPNLVLESRIRVHDYAVSRIAWLDNFLIASIGHDGAVRVRDIRQPDLNLDNVDDGLAWNHCLVLPEPNIIIAGTDQGYLKFVKLSSLDSATSAQMKRKRVQTGSIRDVACVAVPPKSLKTPSKKTAVFSAGAEGVVFLGNIPRPLWTAPKTNPTKFTCNSGRYTQIPFIQWTTHASDKHEPQQQHQGDKVLTQKAEGDELMKDVNPSTPCHIAPPTSSDKLVLESEDLFKIKAAPLVLRLSSPLWKAESERMLSKSSTKVRINVRTDMNLCADMYDQRVLIGRMSVSEKSRLLAMTSFAGFLTVIRITDDVLELSKPKRSSASVSDTPPSKKRRVNRTVGLKQSTPKSTAKSGTPTKPRKRGRPRKNPV